MSDDPYAAMEAATGLRMTEWQRRAYDQIMEGGDPSAPRPYHEGKADRADALNAAAAGLPVEEDQQ